MCTMDDDDEGNSIKTCIACINIQQTTTQYNVIIFFYNVMLLGGEMIVVAGGKRIKNLNIKNLIKWKFTAYFALGSIGKAI